MIVGKIQRFLFSVIKPLCFGERRKLSKCFRLVVLGGHWGVGRHYGEGRHVPCKVHAMYAHNEGFSKSMHANPACITTSTLHSFHVGLCPQLCFLRFFYMCLCVCMYTCV